MARPPLLLSVLSLLTACAIPRTVEQLQERNPPPEFGRPGWVRFCAGTGAWIGGVAGGVVSVALLPISYPISLLAGDSFSETTKGEFLLWPALGGAAAGHFLLGAPTDVIDAVFRRAWFTEPVPEYSFELVPMEPPMTPQPGAGKPAEEPGAPAPAEQKGAEGAGAQQGGNGR